ncbi:Formin [Macleaya cordata]|uniref:Formin-like protein n=1 Tax=Macleaya cordata TaxID=56857 RepID=A0A200QF57_MACCD|nr:Formin [Macleaya cordata]
MHVHNWCPMFQLWLILLFILYFSLLPLSASFSSSTSSYDQFKDPQNIEVFFPFLYSPPILISQNSHFPSKKIPSHQITSSSDGTLAKAVAATVASTVVVAGVFVCVAQRFCRPHLNAKNKMGFRQDEIRVSNNDELKQFGGNIRGLVVDENGLDMIYWRQLQSPQANLPKGRLNENKEVVLLGVSDQRDQKIQNRKYGGSIHQAAGPKSSNSSARIKPELQDRDSISASCPPTHDGISIPGQLKLNPLFIKDKVRANADHSRVPNKINESSSCSNDDVTEALFGYVATNRTSPSPKGNKVSSNIRTSNTNPPAHIFILDPNKSQHTAIILRSIYVTRKEIHDALLEGRMSIHLGTLEKLTRIAPTKEEQEHIFEFHGNPTKLADAESFIYHLLKSVPSPFSRLNAMLFQANFDSKIFYLRDSLQTIELGCNELRIHGVFFKLVEAIAITQGRTRNGFNLIELRNLRNMKNDDGSTNLLQFVVEEVIKSEGKRCINKQNQNFDQRSTHRSKNSTNPKSNSAREKEERDDHEYMMLGLPLVEGICKELSNVKKTALVDYDAFVESFFDLKAGFGEIRDLFFEINGGKEDDGFLKKMKRFLYKAEEEFKVVREEEKRVMELVKRTREIYFQGGAASYEQKDQNPVQLFVMVKEFVSMVDHVCIDIARNLKKMEKEGLRFQRISSIL